MSVTFATTTLPTDRYAVVCGDDHRRDPRTWSTYAEAMAAVQHHTCASVLCEEWRPNVTLLSGPSLNLNDRNAQDVLRLLGLTELDGCATGERFLGRVLMALALHANDPQLPQRSDGRFVECGRRPGYLTERLRELHDLAQQAAVQGREITWG